MNKNKYHVLADIVLFSPENGDRKGPRSTKFLSCPLQFQGRNFYCRLLLEHVGSLIPGEQIQFTNGSEFERAQQGGRIA